MDFVGETMDAFNFLIHLQILIFFLMFLYEFPRLQYPYPAKLPQPEQMFVTRHDESSLTRNGTLKEFVIRGVLVDYRRQWLRLNDLCMNGEQFQKRHRVYLGKSRSELLTDSTVFIDDFRRRQDRYLMVSPGIKNLIGGPVKKTPETKTFVSRTTFTSGLEPSQWRLQYPIFLSRP